MQRFRIPIISNHPISSSEVRTNELNLTMMSLKEVNKTMLTKYEKSKIHTLNLSLNQINHIGENSYDFFRNLKKLDLTSNSIEKLNKTTFAGLNKLEELVLAENLLYEIEMGSFDNMNYLKTINLNSNCIHHLPNIIFFRNYMLKNIFIMENQLENLPSEMLPYNQYLENLNISCNQVVSMDSVLKYIKVRSMDISNNDLIELPMPKNTTTNYIIQPKNIKNHAEKVDSSESSEASSDETTYMKVTFNAKNSGHEWRSSPFGSKNSKSINSYYENQLNREQMENQRNNGFEEVIRSDVFSRNQKSFADQKMDKEENNANLFNTEMKKTRISKSNSIKKYEDSNLSLSESELTPLTVSEDHNIATSQGIHKVWPFSSIEFYDLIKDASINHLKYLTARNCSITSLDFITNFPELILLDLSHNNLNTVNLTAVEDMTNLRVLLLNSNILTDFDYSIILKQWKYFKFIDLSHNNFTCAFVRNIRTEFLNAGKIVRFEANKCL